MVGAVAALTLTVVVALAKACVIPDVKPVPVPVIFVPTSAVGVSNAGDVKLGDVPKTRAPLPVLVVATAEARFADVGVASHVSTPAPNPVIAVTGNPVAFVNTIALGVPNAGVTSVGLVLNTTLPVPVDVVVPVPPRRTGTAVTIEILGSVPPEEPRGLVAVTLLTLPPPPLEVGYRV